MDAPQRLLPHGKRGCRLRRLRPSYRLAHLLSLSVERLTPCEQHFQPLDLNVESENDANEDNNRRLTVENLILGVFFGGWVERILDTSPRG